MRTTIISGIIIVVAVHLNIGYELSCGRNLLPGEEYRDVCTLQDANDLDLEGFGVVGIPQRSQVQIVNAAFKLFDQSHFYLFEKAENMTFWGGTVRKIIFQSSTLNSLEVLYSWLVQFTVFQEDNYSLKNLAIRSDLYDEISPSIRYLKGLQRIDFKACGLKQVNFNHFATMDDLLILILSDNKIHTVAMEPGLQLRHLQLLEIGNNNLTEMEYFPEAFPSLKLVNLVMNRWHCDWVSASRDAIWNNRITVTGADFVCSRSFRNNGGLCCMDRPKPRLQLESVLREVLAKIEDGVVEALEYDVDDGNIRLRIFIQKSDKQESDGEFIKVIG